MYKDDDPGPTQRARRRIECEFWRLT